MTAELTVRGIAYDRAGPGGDLPVVLVHAGVADRRMWDPVWPGLVAGRDAVRLDLRGYGESAIPPDGALEPVRDLLDTMAELGIERCHLVGASYGAGVVVEVALTLPELVESLLLVGPGGVLLVEPTPDLRAFFDAERSALAAGNLDAAVEANLRWWVDGVHRAPDAVDPGVRELVGRMQRRAFELTADWDADEAELDPPAVERLHEVMARTLVLVGALDLDTVLDAANRITDGIPGARRVDWPDVAHLPSMERPDEFLTLLMAWLHD